MRKLRVTAIFARYDAYVTNTVRSDAVVVDRRKKYSSIRVEATLNFQ